MTRRAWTRRGGAPSTEAAEVGSDQKAASAGQAHVLVPGDESTLRAWHAAALRPGHAPPNLQHDRRWAVHLQGPCYF